MLASKLKKYLSFLKFFAICCVCYEIVWIFLVKTQTNLKQVNS